MAEQVTTSTLSDIRCFDVLRYSAATLVGRHRYASFIQELVAQVWLDSKATAHFFKVSLYPVNSSLTDRYKPIFLALSLSHCN